MAFTTPPKKHLIIATRGSALALWQADYVTSLLKAQGVSAEKLIIKTTGDRVQDRFLHEIGGKGLFVREIEQALLEGKADLAIHSLKDMPAKVLPAFTLAAILKRHASDDLFIMRDSYRPGIEMPQSIRPEFLSQFGAMTIGTGSLRRQSILNKYAPEVKTVGIRGNVDTRIRKLQEGEWDAIILAHASIERLGIKGLRSAPLATDWFIPSPSQGALAIECRAGDPVGDWLRILNCVDTEAAVSVERRVLASLGGDCTMPFACIVRAQNGAIFGHAAVYGKNARVAETQKTLPKLAGNVASFADSLVDGLIKAGAEDVLKSIGLTLPR
jgi:hydroxymethylbilane synthase